MMRFIFPFDDSTAGGHITDGLPGIGFRTLIVAIALALVFSFGTHILLKQLAQTHAFQSDLLEKFRANIHEKPDVNLASAILNSPLYFRVPELAVQIGKDSTSPQSEKATSLAKERIDAASFLPEWSASYFATDVAVVQVYLYFVDQCTIADDPKECQRELLSQSYILVSEMKHNPSYILYRLQGGYIQLVASYIFALGVMVFILREFRAYQINAYMRDRIAAERFAKELFHQESNEGADDDLSSLSLRAILLNWWLKFVNGKTGAAVVTVREQLREFGVVYYEPTWKVDGGTGHVGGRIDHDSDSAKEIIQGHASLIHAYHLYLAAVLRRQDKLSATERLRSVLPRTILKVVSAFVVDQKHFPQTARERAGEALEHSVDELAATIAADRDLFSRFVELTPVVGFFGTVWGLSLAMLGANDVIRAQSADWNYDILNGTTYITEALAHVEEKQQFALQGMLSALSIKFDTTGYALILMFLLILFGAHATRREYRAISLLHSNVAQKVLSVLPMFGSVVTEPPELNLKPRPLDTERLETLNGWGPE